MLTHQRLWLANPKAWRHAEYSRNLAAWEAHYPASQVFVGFFDELQDDPGALLQRLLAFLGLDHGAQALPRDVDARRNPGSGELVPSAVEGTLARLLIDEVRALQARFDNVHTRRWLAYTEARL